MFLNLNQVKAYLAKIENWNQLYFIQQGGRGIKAQQIIERLEKAIAKDPKGVFKANEKLWQDMGIDKFEKLENLAKQGKLSTDSKYVKFQKTVLISE